MARSPRSLRRAGVERHRLSAESIAAALPDLLAFSPTSSLPILLSLSVLSAVRDLDPA